MNNDGRIDSPASATRSPKRPSGGDDIVGLLQHLTSQGTHLAQEQVKLVQAEVRAGIDDLKAAIGAMLGAAEVGVAGFGVLVKIGRAAGRGWGVQLVEVLGVGVCIKKQTEIK